MADVKFEPVAFSIPQGTAGGTFSVAAPAGFGTPKAAMFIGSHGPSLDVIKSSARFSMGFTDGVRQGASAFNTSANLATTNTSRGDYPGVIGFPGNTAGGSYFVFSRWLSQGVDGIDGVEIQFVDDVTVASAGIVVFIGGDDIAEVYVDQIQMPASPGNVVITDPGFTPDLALFSASITSGTPPSFEATAFFMHGAAINDGIETQRGISIRSTNGQATSDVYAGLLDSSVLANIGGGPAFANRITVNSFDAQGFTINIEGSNQYLNYLAIRFTNSPDLALFDTLYPTGSGDYIETQAGFTPNFGFIGSYETAAVAGTPVDSNAYGLTSVAFSDSALTSASASDEDTSGYTASSSSIYATSFVGLGKDGAISVQSPSVTMTPTGWTMPLTSNPASSNRGYALAIGPGGAPPVGVQEMYIKDGGIFVKYTPHVKVGGTFQEVDAYVLEAGSWVPVHEK